MTIQYASAFIKYFFINTIVNKIIRIMLFAPEVLQFVQFGSLLKSIMAELHVSFSNPAFPYLLEKYYMVTNVW